MFHYLALHDSEYYRDKHDGRILNNTVRFADCLVRLPMFYELTNVQVDKIVQIISENKRE